MASPTSNRNFVVLVYKHRTWLHPCLNCVLTQKQELNSCLWQFVTPVFLPLLEEMFWRDLKAPLTLEGTELGDGRSFCVCVIPCHLPGWAGLHMPRVPHPTAGAEPGPEPEQICTTAVRWMLSRESPVSPTRSAWLANKVYERPTLCNNQ